jgi:hypothetical protein
VNDEQGTQPQTWAIIDMAGHQRVAGCISAEVVAGVQLMRVDVPEVKRATGDNLRPAFHFYLGEVAIYRVSLTDETTARAAAEWLGAMPVPADYRVQEVQVLALETNETERELGTIPF